MSTEVMIALGTIGFNLAGIISATVWVVGRITKLQGSIDLLTYRLAQLENSHEQKIRIRRD